MENKSSGLKLTNEILTFQLNFVLEAYLTDLVLLSLNGNVYDFSVDYDSINKSDILSISKYLMNKNK